MSQGAGAEKRTRFKSGNRNVFFILIGFIAVITVVQMLFIRPGSFPTMISPSNLMNILIQVSATGIMAMGMTMVMIAGGIDLSVGMLTSFVALYTAKSFIDWNYPLAVAIIAAILLAVLFESAMGWIISRLKVEPFIITLGGMTCFRGVALLIVNSQEVSMQGALNGLKNSIIPPVKDPAGLIINVPPYIFVFIAITVIVWWVLKYTKYGRRIYAVGANPQAAYLAGINVKNVILSTYALNGLIVGIGAICLLARVNTAIISTGQNREIDVIAAAVIGGIAMSGGKGNAWGVFLGAILMGAIENGMNILRLKAEWQFVAKGLIIIGAVVAAAVAANLQNRRQLMAQQTKTKQEGAGDAQVDH